MTSREGIEIDYCPQCRGVWLDRGELDKIIDRSVTTSSPEPYREKKPEYRPEDKTYYRGHKPKNILKEIFDF